MTHRVKRDPRGRKPKPPSERRNVPLWIRLTRDERDQVDSEAERSEISLSAWIRAKLLPHKKTSGD